MGEVRWSVRETRVTRNRIIVMQIIGMYFGSNLGAFAAGPDRTWWQQYLIFGLVTVASTGLWLGTYGIYVDHNVAVKGLWRSMWVHSLGLTASVILTLVVAVMLEPLAIWFLFAIPVVPFVAMLLPLAAAAVPGSFRVAVADTDASQEGTNFNRWLRGETLD